MKGAALRLVAIDRAGQPVEGGPRLDEPALEVCRSTAALYARCGFVPPWLGYLATAGDDVVGTCAFKSAPAAGEVEIAYFTFPRFEGRGIATAMARQLVSLARAIDPTLVLMAHTLPSANASTRVLEKLGFNRTGTGVDEEVGEVWQWKLAGEARPVAAADKSRKYALPECERRFLLAALPATPITRTVVIDDHYIAGTRLRLRKMVDTVGTATVTSYKLTQKVPAADGAPGLLTTAYLTEAEHGVFATLPGSRLRKTRYGMVPFVVDVFEAPLAGLFIAEIEFESAAEMGAFVPPDAVVAEITRDARFTGGRLVSTTRSELLEALASFGLRL
jgi:CYTH domain-containing protein/GNAT superfamily N-acetyltransferase